MLSRKQLRLVQILRGLPVGEIIQRTGIPNQSLMTLINGSEKDGKDPSKLISQTTLDRVLALLGIDEQFSGLRPNVVNEWRYSEKNVKGTPSWRDAFHGVRKELMSDEIEIAEIKKDAGWLSGKETLLLIHDIGTDVRIIIAGANEKAQRFIETALGAKVTRTELMAEADFEFTKKLIQHGVYRVTQFNIILGGKSARYNWTDVQSAAKEFNFHTDDLINMMVERVGKQTIQLTESPSQGEIKIFPRSALG